MSIRTPSRHGGFLKFLIGVVVIAALVVLGWGVFANWQRDADGDGQPDGFSLRVLDPQWWDASKQDAQPLVAQARDWALERKEQIWGEGGYVDQGESWLEEWRAQKQQQQPATGDAATPPADGAETGQGKLQTGRGGEDGPGSATSLAPAPEADPAPTASPEPRVSPATRRQEERIEAAEEAFAQGLEEFRAADPAGGWTDERIAHYDQAREHFLQVRRILVDEGTVENYEALDDHDPLIATKAKELAQLNQKLLYDATKAGGGL